MTVPDRENTRHGLWSVAKVPHKGWLCTDVEDLGSPSWLCEMCQSKTIRYVHHMCHPDYSGPPHHRPPLRVGCICAGNMEQNRTGAHKRERRFIQHQARRSRWLQRNWRRSAKGNNYLKVNGSLVVLFKDTAGAWRFCVDGQCRGPFVNNASAALGAFDFLWPHSL